MVDFGAELWMSPSGSGGCGSASPDNRRGTNWKPKGANAEMSKYAQLNVLRQQKGLDSIPEIEVQQGLDRLGEAIFVRRTGIEKGVEVTYDPGRHRAWFAKCLADSVDERGKDMGNIKTYSALIPSLIIRLVYLSNTNLDEIRKAIGSESEYSVNKRVSRGITALRDQARIMFPDDFETVQVSELLNDLHQRMLTYQDVVVGVHSSANERHVQGYPGYFTSVGMLRIGNLDRKFHVYEITIDDTRKALRVAGYNSLLAAIQVLSASQRVDREKHRKTRYNQENLQDMIKALPKGQLMCMESLDEPDYRDITLSVIRELKNRYQSRLSSSQLEGITEIGDSDEDMGQWADTIFQAAKLKLGRIAEER